MTAESGDQERGHRTLLLVVDLQQVVGVGGPWELPGVAGVVDVAARLVEQHEGPALATRHRPVPGDPATLGPFAEQQDPAALSGDAAALVPALGQIPAVDKQTYSALSCRPVEAALAQVDAVTVCGVETDCCVLATVFDLLDAGIPTTVVTDGVTGPDAAAHEGALRTMGRLGDLVQLVGHGQLLADTGPGSVTR